MNLDEKKTLSLVRYEHAKDCLTAAQKLIEQKCYKDATNRSYYAIFHAMRSVLVLEGVDMKHHSGIISEFRRRYIKTEIFDDRWEADYYISESFIQFAFPEYKHKEGNVIRGNFYKCSDTKEIRHYGCFNLIETPTPNMHATEYFTEFKLV